MDECKSAGGPQRHGRKYDSLKCKTGYARVGAEVTFRQGALSACPPWGPLGDMQSPAVRGSREGTSRGRRGGYNHNNNKTNNNNHNY